MKHTPIVKYYASAFTQFGLKYCLRLLKLALKHLGTCQPVTNVKAGFLINAVEWQRFLERWTPSQSPKRLGNTSKSAIQSLEVNLGLQSVYQTQERHSVTVMSDALILLIEMEILHWVMDLPLPAFPG